MTEDARRWGSTTFNVMITKFAGPDPQVIKYVVIDNGAGATINEFDMQSSTLYGHANAAGAEAVGAAFYLQTPEFGVSPALLERFSSAGSTPILFGTIGNRLAISEIRLKPEIVAPDGTNTTFFGRDVEPDGFPNFFGTSAAAPHAAALAALMLQAAPTTAPETVYDILETTALDMAPPGFDFDSGFGLIQADEALATLGNGTPAVILYAGYLDNEHGSRNLAETPRPFDPDSRTILISTGGADTTHDTGVIRFENRTDAPVIIDPGLRVIIGKRAFQLWDNFLPITLASGQNLILAETANFNFDTSDFRLTRDPVVHGSMNGRKFSFTDTARILLGREEAGAKDINETTRYQILGRIDGQVPALARIK